MAELRTWWRRLANAPVPLPERPVLLTAAAALVLGLAIGISSFVLQNHFSDQYQAGARLAGWQNFLRLGAPWQALLPVLLAGLLATIGALRMGRSAPEPPLTLGRTEARTAGQLRASMRTERRFVRIAYLAMTGLVGIVLVRCAVYAVWAQLGSSLAQSTRAGVAVELGVWLLAWAAVWNWNRVYRAQMESWGVLLD